MSNDLWFHALKILDIFRNTSNEEDLLKLYEFQDQTGILDKIKKHEPYYEEEGKIDVKVMYQVLIKMVLDEQRKNKGCLQAKQVEKIAGFQELTNR